MLKLAVLTIALPLSCIAVPALAATAHNSQAGSEGGTKNTCADTPYFGEGGCASSDLGGILDDDDDNGLPRGSVAPPRRLRAPADED